MRTMHLCLASLETIHSQSFTSDTHWENPSSRQHFKVQHHSHLYCSCSNFNDWMNITNVPQYISVPRESYCWTIKFCRQITVYILHLFYFYYFLPIMICVLLFLKTSCGLPWFISNCKSKTQTTSETFPDC